MNRFKKAKELRILKFADSNGEILIENQTIKFGDKINLLIGPNGGGKTTLLKILQACISFDFSELRKNIFKISSIVSEKDITIKSDFSNFKVENEKIQFETGVISILNFDIQFQSKNEKLILIKGGDFVNVSYSNNDKTSEIKFLTGSIYNLETIIHQIRKWLSGINSHNLLNLTLFPQIEFNERGKEDINDALKMFNLELEEIRVEKKPSSQYPKATLSPYNLKNFELMNIISNELIKQIILKKMKKIDQNVEIFFESDFLNSIKNKFQFFDNYFFLFKKNIGVIDGYLLRKGVLKFTKNDKEVDLDIDFTWGQKRLIYILAKIEKMQIPLIDEIENGFHPDWVDSLLDRIVELDKQAFITTHSHNIINSLEPETPIELEESIILCRIKDEKLSFKNLSQNKAEKIFGLLETELVQLSDTLFVNGVW